MPLISCDAAALEWRVLAELSRDEVAIKEILEGQDIHSNNQKAFNLPSRLISKKYLFRSIYNWGKGFAFTHDAEFMHVSTSVKYWDDIGEKFYTKYKGIDDLYKKNLNIIAKKQPIVGPLGREWLIPYKEDGNLPITKAVNYPTQGTGHDIMSIARVSFYNRLKKSPYIDKTLMRSTVHDSIAVDAPSAYVEPLAHMFHGVFADLQKNIKKLFNYTWVVPLACEVKAGPDMKNMEKIK